METENEENPIRRLYDSMAADGPMDDRRKAMFLNQVGEATVFPFLEAFKLAEVQDSVSLRLVDDSDGNRYDFSFRRLDPDEEPFPMNVYVAITEGGGTCMLIAAINLSSAYEIAGKPLKGQFTLVKGVEVKGKQRIIEEFSLW